MRGGGDDGVRGVGGDDGARDVGGDDDGARGVGGDDGARGFGRFTEGKEGVILFAILASSASLFSSLRRNFSKDSTLSSSLLTITGLTFLTLSRKLGRGAKPFKPCSGSSGWATSSGGGGVGS